MLDQPATGLHTDENAAAYGLFQVLFAGLDTRLSLSRVQLLRSENPKLAFAIVSKMPLGKRLEVFRKVVEKFGQGQGRRLGQELSELKEAFIGDCRVRLLR